MERLQSIYKFGLMKLKLPFALHPEGHKSLSKGGVCFESLHLCPRGMNGSNI
jgi:hypothetical protein